MVGRCPHPNVGRAAIASSAYLSAKAPANHADSVVMGTSLPMVWALVSVLRPAHTIWRVLRQEAGVRIMVCLSVGVCGGVAPSANRHVFYSNQRIEGLPFEGGAVCILQTLTQHGSICLCLLAGGVEGEQLRAIVIVVARGEDCVDFVHGDDGSNCQCSMGGGDPSVTVADVDRLGGGSSREGEGATLSECLTVGGRPCHHGVVLLRVGCHDGGEVNGLGVGHRGRLN